MSAEEWTPDRIKFLIALWDEGLPTSEIGRRLGVTKNAVVGKVHRLGLKKRASPIRQMPSAGTVQPRRVKAEAKAPAAEAAEAAAPAAPTPVMPSGDAVKLEELTSTMCCWPEGEPGTPEFHFCGRPAVAEKPYCEGHCARAYVKVSKDKKKKSFEAA